ncbi:unnamed protein product [Rotaria sordida]|uniref:Uncharacterized protein n=2 Tax=Rotaria sordida TaxID=392033 RepID=A0A814GL31_9BILA|nr:unnamed protein product [Rotaria sordida]
MSNEVQMRTSIEQTQFELIPFEQQPTPRLWMKEMTIHRHENGNEQNMSNEVQIRTPIEPTPFEPIPFEQQSTRKRKSDEKLDSEILSHEIDSSKQKTIRNLRPKRCRQ